MPESSGLTWDPIAEAHRRWTERGWGDAADGMAVVTSVMRTQQLLLTQIDGLLRPFGLTFSRFELLRLLSFAGDAQLSMARAGERLQVHPTSLGNAVKRLESDGLVRRAAHPEDGRALVLELLPAGRELVEAATAVLNEHVFAPLEVSPEELRTLIAILARFRSARGDFAPSQEPTDTFG
jgi:DNA-binding MarR family transcriptional regulator